MINIEKHAEQGWTQSEVGTMDDCGYKWFLSYNLGLRLKGSFSWALVFGDAFHRTLEDAYENGGILKREGGKIAPMRFDDDVVLSGLQEQKYEYYKALLEVIIEVYLEHYRLDFKTFRLERGGIERDACVEIVYRNIPIKLRGKIDLHGIFSKCALKKIADHKTCSSIQMANVLGWDFRFQFMFYVWLLIQMEGKHACKGFMVNAVKKTQLHQKKDESLNTFMARVRMDMRTRPEEYFYRKELVLMQGQMDNFVANVLTPKLERIATLQNPDIPDHIKAIIALNRNTESCYKYGTDQACQFLPICQNSLQSQLNNYEQRPNKHAELATE